MPVNIEGSVHLVGEREFAQAAYEVMGCLFEIHSAFGRFCDEDVYKHALALRMGNIQLETPIEVQ